MLINFFVFESAPEPFGEDVVSSPKATTRAFGTLVSVSTTIRFIMQSPSKRSVCFAIQYEAASKVLDALKKPLNSRFLEAKQIV